MASLYIKSDDAAVRVAQMAQRLRTTKTEVVLRGITALEEKLAAEQPKQNWLDWIREHRRANPLPAPTGLKADKAFYDWLSGEEDVVDPFR